nr:secreted frizzled-related protein 3-like isoform X3 [Cherax quadricarinatus]
MGTTLQVLPSTAIPVGFMWAAWIVWAVVGSSGMWVVEGEFGPQCEEIKIPMCQNMPYNLTRLPNLLHHSTQENAQLAIEQFELLGWTKCSDQLEFFLCSMYVPICTVGFANEAIPPCRSVCEAARLGCEPLLAKFNIPWPTNLQCHTLPVYDRGVCITPQAIIASDVKPRPSQEQVPCECRQQRPLRQGLYTKLHFDYVLRGSVKSVDTYGELTLTTVLVKEVVKAGRVLVLTATDAYLWTNRSCICPPLSINQDYLLLGWEDFTNSRLLYLDGSVALPYKKKYVRKILKWEGVTMPPPTPSLQPLLAPLPSTLGPLQPRIQMGNHKKKRKRRRKNNQLKKQINKQRRKERRRSKTEREAL